MSLNTAKALKEDQTRKITELLSNINIINKL